MLKPCRKSPFAIGGVSVDSKSVESKGTAKEVILGRIREIMQGAPEAEPIARDYIRTSDHDAAARMDLFTERLVDYGADVHHVSPKEIAKKAAELCEARGVESLVVPTDVPQDWLPEVEVRPDEGLGRGVLESTGGVMTGCTLAIAQTGTIVLDGGERQGRRVITLLPDFHICVVFAEQIAGIVPEAVSRLESSAKRPLTFVSGPSATSDIELSRVEGVHGPRSLAVLVVKGAT